MVPFLKTQWKCLRINNLVCIMVLYQPNKVESKMMENAGKVNESRVRKTPILSSIWIMIQIKFSILWIIVLKFEIFCRTCTSWISISFYLSRMLSVSVSSYIFFFILLVSVWLFIVWFTRCSETAARRCNHKNPCYSFIR